MPKRLTLTLASCLVVLAAALPAFAAPRTTPASKSPPTEVEHVYMQHLTLTGQAEKPRGETGGSGGLTVCLNQTANTVEFSFDAITVRGQPTSGRIERGAVGVSGPTVVTFTQPGLLDPSTGEVEWNDSVTATAATIAALISGPKGFYVNVHTKAYPKGAVRGQLGAWKKATIAEGDANECGVG